MGDVAIRQPELDEKKKPQIYPHKKGGNEIEQTLNPGWSSKRDALRLADVFPLSG
jgi:hypothetical protein